MQRVTEVPFDPWQVLAERQQGRTEVDIGATAVFVGTMRDFSQRQNLQRMRLEHYPAMTERHLDKLVHQAQEKWSLLDCLVLHRVGEIRPGDPIVLIACWSSHRRAALDACNWLIEALKHEAPLWKQEFGPDGARWVQGNTDGHGEAN